MMRMFGWPIIPRIFLTICSVGLVAFAYWADDPPIMLGFVCLCCGLCIGLAFAVKRPEGER